jgi:hypothetical protein
MPLQNPLTQEHCDCIQRVIQSIPNIRETIAACEQCGMTFEQERELLKAQEEFATRVKSAFMPNLP